MDTQIPQPTQIQAPTIITATPNPTPLPEKDSYTTFNTMVKNIIFFLLGLVITGSSIAGGVLLYTAQNGGSSSLLPFQKVVNKLSNTETVVQPTDNFVTGQTQENLYQNATFNLSFVIPSEYQAKESSYGLGVTSVELRKQENLNEAAGPNIQVLIFPKSLGSLIGQDFDSYRAMKDNAIKQVNDSQGTQLFTKLTNRTVNTLPAFDYKTISATPSTNEEAEAGTYIEAGPNIFIISAPESMKATLEPILESFKYPLK